MLSLCKRVPLAAALLVVAPPAPAQDDAAAEVRVTVHRLYDAISFAPKSSPDFAALESLFLDGATVLLPYREAEGPSVQSAPAFVAAFRQAVEAPGASARGFHERSVGMEVTVHGRVAQATSIYEMRDTAGQEDFQRRGVDLLLLAREGSGWKILSLTTDFEREGHPLSAGLRALAAEEEDTTDGDDAPVRFLSFPEALAELADSGHAWRNLLSVAGLRAGIYRLPAGADDDQPVHRHDELYFVVEGRARFEAGDASRPVGPGDVVFVAAGQPHRFTGIEEDLALWVVFGSGQ